MNNMTMPTQLPGDKKWKGYTLEQLFLRAHRGAGKN